MAHYFILLFKQGLTLRTVLLSGTSKKCTGTIKSTKVTCPREHKNAYIYNELYDFSLGQVDFSQ